MLDKLSAVSFCVRHMDSKSKAKVVHIKSTKIYTERMNKVNRLTVLAEETHTEPQQ